MFLQPSVHFVMVNRGFELKKKPRVFGLVFCTRAVLPGECIRLGRSPVRQRKIPGTRH